MEGNGKIEKGATVVCLDSDAKNLRSLMAEFTSAGCSCLGAMEPRAAALLAEEDLSVDHICIEYADVVVVCKVVAVMHDDRSIRQLPDKLRESRARACRTGTDEIYRSYWPTREGH